MPSLDAVEKQFPGACTVAGRVVAMHKGVHTDLGAYVGEGMVVLSPEAEKLMQESEPARKSGRRGGKVAEAPAPEAGSEDVKPDDLEKDIKSLDI